MFWNLWTPKHKNKVLNFLDVLLYVLPNLIWFLGPTQFAQCLFNMFMRSEWNCKLTDVLFTAAGMKIPAVAALAFVVLTGVSLASPGYWAHDCDGNYTVASNYQKSLKQLSAGLPDAVSSSPDLFDKKVLGSWGSRVYGLGRCRPGIDASTCKACLDEAFQEAQVVCPLRKRVYMYYEVCTLAFADEDLPSHSAFSSRASERVEICSDVQLQVGATPLLRCWQGRVSHPRRKKRWVGHIYIYNRLFFSVIYNFSLTNGWSIYMQGRSRFGLWWVVLRAHW